jgi:hypothetical protein
MTRRRLPALPADEVLRALERAGFSVHRVEGSHHHPIEDGRVLWFQYIGVICRRAGYGRSSGRQD